MRRMDKMDRTAGYLLRMLTLLAGAFLIAASFNLFMLPNRIASGGVSGLSVIVYHLFGLTPAYVQWSLNVPILIAGLAVFGLPYFLRTAIGSLFLPLFVLLTAHWTPLTNNPLLAAIFGGLGIGLGIGIVFRARSSTGGMDTVAQMLNRYRGTPLGMAVVILDGAVILLAGLLISPENALYALIGLYVTGKTIDVVQAGGLPVSKAAIIVSRKPERIATDILRELHRGLTIWPAKGGYTGEIRPVLLTVVGRNEVSRLKALVQRADPDAFVIISDTAEVLGEGFRRPSPSP